MKRITFITGHYGSGKSEFSVNFAIQKKVDMLVDLDIINPYFRSREAVDFLNSHNIELLASTIENSLGSDLPYISKEIYLPFYKNYLTAIYDLGGDEAGAKLLRQFSKVIEDVDVDLLLCVNVFREETSTKEKIIKTINEIETAGGVRITGIINNSNFLRNTTYNDILEGEEIIKELARGLNLEILYTAVYEDLLANCGPLMGEIMPLKPYLRKKWL